MGRNGPRRGCDVEGLGLEGLRLESGAGLGGAMTRREFERVVSGLRYLTVTPSQEEGYTTGRVHLFEDGWKDLDSVIPAPLGVASEERLRELLEMREDLLGLRETGLSDWIVQADRNNPPLESWMADQAEILTRVPVSNEQRWFLDQLSGELTTVVMLYKHLWNTPRPYQYFDALGWADVPQFIGESARSPSYPSGHAVISRFVARVLSSIRPENAAIYGRLAQEVSNGRVTAGWHFPSDIQGGYALADALWPLLTRGAQRWIAEQKEMVRKAGG